MAEDDADRWDAKYVGRGMPTVGPTAALARLEAWLPPRGCALDVAGGDGGQAVWLTTRGLEVTLCDISEVALERARQLAAREGGPLETVRTDLETDPLPPGPWDVVLCTNYLQVELWPAVAQVLAVGGVAIWAHPTVINLERHAQPSRRFLLAPGDGCAALEHAGLSIQHAEETWVGDRHMSCVVGRRDA